ncbi:MAG: type II toxin-antitoxin system VapC family toxin [Ignavibacteriales bacterium]|nr:type II toxin-antitoxin system VapC family toxin [Ignavibacteriales bacterium]
MNGTNAILDSNIIIYLSKGILHEKILLEKYQRFYVSIITYIEVLGYKFQSNEEKSLVERLFDKFEIIPIDMNIATIAIEIRQQKKIKLPDALILATAKKFNADLITNNIADFENIEDSISIIKP